MLQFILSQQASRDQGNDAPEARGSGIPNSGNMLPEPSSSASGAGAGAAKNGSYQPPLWVQGPPKFYDATSPPAPVAALGANEASLDDDGQVRKNLCIRLSLLMKRKLFS